MEGDKFSSGNETLEFRQIVLMHIKRILEISSSELRNKTITKNHGNFSETIEQEDTRYSYIQSIENLSYVLMPYFDEQMQKVYTECSFVINAYNFELEKYFTKDIQIVLANIKQDKIPEIYFIKKKIEYAKKLFIELNFLLKRVDYLKTAIYGEDSGEEVIEELEGDRE